MFGTIQNIVQAIGDIVNTLLPVLVAVALAAFFWGIVKYISSAGDPGKAKEGKSIMIAGIIALFVMVSIWGIIELIGRELDIDQGGGIDVPTIEPGGSAGNDSGSFDRYGDYSPDGTYYPGGSRDGGF